MCSHYHIVGRVSFLHISVSFAIKMCDGFTNIYIYMLYVILPSRYKVAH